MASNVDMSYIALSCNIYIVRIKKTSLFELISGCLNRFT